MWIMDGLRNLVSGLGYKGKAIANEFYFEPIAQNEIDAMYRGDWLARKIVDIVPADMTREWRTWQADESESEKIYAAEKALNLRAKVAEALKWARLYGGAAILIGDGSTDPRAPLDADRIGMGGIKYLHVFHRWELHSGERNTDIASPWFGLPETYRISTAGLGTSQIEVHRTRFAIFDGQDVPRLHRETNNGWGDSIYEAVRQAVTNAASSAANSAELIQESKLDVITVPDLMTHLADAESERRLKERFTLAMTMKSTVNTLLLGGGETYERKTTSFTGLVDMMHAFLQQAAGAADIPVTRLLGQSPAGMNSTGESDLRNYYDHLRSKQSTDLSETLDRLDEMLIRHALGSRPPKIAYEWAPLWQMTPKEKAEVDKANAETDQIYVNLGLFNDDVMQASIKDRLVANGVYPAIEAHVDEFGEGVPEDEPPPVVQVAPGEEGEIGGRQPADLSADAAPRTLYVSRKVMNGAEIVRWAKAQGFTATLPADKMHVTIAFSRAPVDWMKVGEAWQLEMKITAGGPRIMERFGKATVLLFKSSELEWRHEAIRAVGASWDYVEYQPHVTISYEDDRPLSDIEPYQGEIVLGPEVFEEVQEDWAAREVGA